MSANGKKYVTRSFLDQIDDEDVLAAILKLRRRGNQPELLPVKDKTPVLHRLLEQSAKLIDEQRTLENKIAVKNQYVEEFDDDDVFAALHSMQRKMPPQMKALYREIDLNHQGHEKSQLILPPSMRKRLVAEEEEDGKVDDSLDKVPRAESFNTTLQNTQISKNSSEHVAALSKNRSEHVATSKQYDMPEQETSIERDEIAFRHLSREETEETATEAVAGVSLQFDGVYEWKVVSVAEKIEKEEVEAQDSSQGQDKQIEKLKRRGFFKKMLSVGNSASAAASDHIAPESPLLRLEHDQDCEVAVNGNDAENHVSVQVQDRQIEKPKRRGLLRKMLAYTASDESASWQLDEARDAVEARSELELPDEDHEIEKPKRFGLLRRSRSSGNLATADIQDSSSRQVEGAQQSEVSREAALSAFVQDVILPSKGKHRFRTPKLRTVLRGIRAAASRANPFTPGDSDDGGNSSHVEDENEKVSREVLETENEFDSRSGASLLDQDHDFKKSKFRGLLKRIKASRSRANTLVSDDNDQEEAIQQREVAESEKDFEIRSLVSPLDREQDHQIEKSGRHGLLKKMLSSASLPKLLGPAKSEHESSPLQVNEGLRGEESEATLASSPRESNLMKKSKQTWLVKRVRSTGDLASMWAQYQHDHEILSYQLDEDQGREAPDAALSDCGISSPYESHRIKTQKRRWLVNSAKSIDAAESDGSPNQSDLDPKLRSFDNQDVHTQACRRSRNPRHMEQLRSRWRSARKEAATGKSHEEVDGEESQRAGVLVEEHSLQNQETIPSVAESPGHLTRLKKRLLIRRKQSSEESADHAVPDFLPHQHAVETHADPSPKSDSVLPPEHSSSLISEIRQQGDLDNYDNISYHDESGYIELKNARRRARLKERKLKYPHSVHPTPNVSCGAANSDDIESKVLRATDLVCGDGNASTVRSTARTDGFKAKSNPSDRSHSFFGVRALCQDDLIPYTCNGSSTGERASDHQDGQIFDRILDYFEKIGCQNEELFIEGDDDESFAGSSLAYSRAESSAIFTQRKTSLASTEASTVEDDGTITI